MNSPISLINLDKNKDVSSLSPDILEIATCGASPYSINNISMAEHKISISFRNLCAAV